VNNLIRRKTDKLVKKWDSTGGSPLTKRSQASEEVGQYRRLSSNKEKPS
jgi:hypothetical protein